MIQRFSIEWKLELLYQIAIILDYIHLRGLAHLDLKPGNILFRAAPRADVVPQPVLIDFGIAERKALAQEVKAATLMYASPERAVEITGIHPPYRVTTNHDVNHTAADIWAFGVMAFEILVGQYPFQLGKSKEELARSILLDDLPPLQRPDLPQELEAVLRDMLTKPRDNRPTIHQVIAMLETRIPIYPPRLRNA